MKAIKVHHQSDDINALALQLENQEQPTPAPGECVVKVYYSGVNPSDVGATLGVFPRAKWPRYTGRDYAGVIIDGPAELVGKEVWGTGGELGIRRDGSHAAYLVIPVAAVSVKPENISMPEAAGIGVPFITAYEGLRRAGLPKPNDRVLIFGGNGKVGQAATQIATRLGAKVIGVEPGALSYKGFSNSPVTMIDSARENVEKAVHDITGGHGADIVYNTVGSPCFEDAVLAMAHGATQIFISDRAKKDVPFSIFRFYRHQHKFVGIDTQELDVVQCAEILNELKPGFADGTLKPFTVTEEYIYSLDRAHEAYRNRVKREDHPENTRMRRYTLVIAIALMSALFSQSVSAQDPKLPPTNLGLSNMQDGKPPGTGWFFQQYIQSYQTQSNRGPEGNDAGGAKINSILSLSQLIWISKIKVAGGNLGFTLLVPLISLSATGGVGTAPSINPSPWGDIITGPFIQWFNRHFFGMPLDHRFETDVIAPTGAYQQAYAVNPGSHLYSIATHYTFTVSPTEKFSISMRHYLTYNFDQIDTRAKPGAFYNFNYSLEYAVISSFRVEAAGYYLTQLVQDSYNGDDHYYQQMDQIPNTRERVFAYGPGVGYVTPTGLFIELKGMWETAAVNRSEGFRGTLVLAYKLNK